VRLAEGGRERDIVCGVEVRYARSGEVEIAFRVLGSGPTTLVLVAGAFTNLEVLWELPDYRRFCEQLGSFCRLVLFDKRGMGLSDRVVAGTIEERMDDVRAVLDAVGASDAVLLGSSEGGPMSLLFAATYPERTRALVLCGAEVKEEITEDWPWGEGTRAEFEEYMAGLAERWGRPDRPAAAMVGSGLDTPAMREWMARLRVQAATPRVAEAFMRMAFEIDVRHVASAIAAPTLVIHRTGDLVCHVENGRFLAASIPGAKYVELPGDWHLLFAGGGEEIVAEIREFLTGVREPEEPDRVLTTLLFTDIVGSTEHARSLGDRRWRELLERHHDAMRRELARFRGREVDTAGDGFFATFDGPARAIRCARSAVDSVRKLGLEIRVGLHTGEVELAGGGVRGIAVHTAARVAALAGPNEVLVSGTVKDLIAGSGINLAERGMRELKGIPGKWRLYAVV
jgi:class 3 adenylate cyclase